MNKTIQRILLSGIIIICITAPLKAVTVTLTYEDPLTVMGSLNNDDADTFSQVAISMAEPSKPYISTAFFGGGHSHVRRGIAEFALEPMRDISSDPNAVNGGLLRFYFDDVIFPENSPEPYTTQNLTVELYIDTANGTLDGSDPNENDASIVGSGPDDWEGEVVQSWNFRAGPVEGLVAGNSVVGIFTPDEPFPEKFDDDKLTLFGMIGFEVDLTEALRSVISDPNVTHIGIRWISNTEGGYWTSMDPKGHLPSLVVDMAADGPLTFELQSTDSGAVEGNHAGRPYHIFNDLYDEAIYLTVGEWQGGHFPDAVWTWPLADGIISWNVFTDPNRSSDRPEAVTYDTQGNTLYVYWNPENEDYALFADQNDVPEGLEKVYYSKETDSGTLNIGNNGIPSGGYADRQHVLLSEFNLMRPKRYGLDPNNLVSAHVGLTIDRVIDMSHNGNNMALLPTVLFVNAYDGDGVLNDFTNAQTDFERIDHENADATVWLTMDGTPDANPITDFALVSYRLVDPGLNEQFTIYIDVTEAVRELLADDAEYTGFVLSCSADGDFTLASVDLVDTVNGTSYLPTLVLETNLQ
ncbi:MAG: hypothetical protein JW837_02790 [Sedimentisphaerales bacterium]|nr:hypothetical protein [Sedimentisphaerales bacterium]